MTPDQAQELLTAVHDLQQIGMGLGLVLGQGVIWLQALCILMLIAIFFLAMRRNF